MRVKKLDSESYRIGIFAGSVTRSEAARSGSKQMSLNSSFSAMDHNLLSPYVEKATHENHVKFYLEKPLMTTDLFADVGMKDKWVFIIYKEERVLEDYLSHKAKKECL